MSHYTSSYINSYTVSFDSIPFKAFFETGVLAHRFLKDTVDTEIDKIVMSSTS